MKTWVESSPIYIHLYLINQCTVPGIKYSIDLSKHDLLIIIYFLTSDLILSTVVIMSKSDGKHATDDGDNKIDLILDEMKHIRNQNTTIVSTVNDNRLELSEFKEKIEQVVSTVKQDLVDVKQEIDEVKKSQHFHSLQYDGFKKEQNTIIKNHVTLENKYAVFLSYPMRTAKTLCSKLVSLWGSLI